MIITSTPRAHVHTIRSHFGSSLSSCVVSVRYHRGAGGGRAVRTRGTRFSSSPAAICVLCFLGFFITYLVVFERNQVVRWQVQWTALGAGASGSELRCKPDCKIWRHYRMICYGNLKYIAKTLTALEPGKAMLSSWFQQRTRA